MGYVNRSISRRGFLGAGAATAGIATLTACGGDSGGVSGGDDGDLPNLSQWYHQYGEEGVEDAVRRWADEYADANLTVEWTLGDYGAKLSSRLLAGSGVDLFENNEIDVPSAREGLYADLTDLVEPLVDSFSSIALKPVTIDDRYWGVPMITDVQLFFYRPSLFDAAGVAVPTTWDELVEAAKTLTAGDQKGLFFGNDGGAGLVAANFPFATGSGLLSEDNTEITYDTPEFVEAAAKARELYDAGALLLGAPTDWWDPTSFNAGLAAMTWQGMWAVPAMVDALGDDVGAFAIPAIGSGGTPAVGISQWNMQVAGSTSDVEAATAVVRAQWIDDAAWQEEFALAYGFHVPPITAVADGAEALSEGVAAEVVALAADHGVTPGPYYTPAMGTALSDAISRVITEGADPAAEISAAAATAQSELDALNQ